MQKKQLTLSGTRHRYCHISDLAMRIRQPSAAMATMTLSTNEKMLVEKNEVAAIGGISIF